MKYNKMNLDLHKPSAGADTTKSPEKYVIFDKIDDIHISVGCARIEDSSSSSSSFFSSAATHVGYESKPFAQLKYRAGVHLPILNFGALIGYRGTNKILSGLGGVVVDGREIVAGPNEGWRTAVDRDAGRNPEAEVEAVLVTEEARDGDRVGEGRGRA